MPTTIHLSDSVVRRLDARARALGISRNRLIVDAILERLGGVKEWPPELAQALAEPLDPLAAKALDDTLGTVRKQRRSRARAPEL